MQVISVRKLKSPLIPEFLRIAAELRFERGEPRTVWFDVPARFESVLSDRGEPWAVLLLPCAAVVGEDLAIDLPVDPALLYNLNGVQQVWQSWYRWLKPVRIEAPPLPNPVVGTDTALFFSGGVDSYFSLIGAHSDADHIGVPRPDSLLTAWGFDIPLSRPEEFARLREMGEHAAGFFRKEFIPIATNLRELDGFGSQWGDLSHGAAMASVGHLLSNRFGNVLIGSTHDYSRLSPWGSHPLVDPQLSSARTSIIHDGTPSSRFEKIERVCSVPEAARALRVCWALNGASNCSRCGKCLRTMLVFDLLGKRHLAESFDWTDYSLDRIAMLFLRDMNDISIALSLRKEAEERGRRDIVRALDRGVQRSRRLRAVRAISGPVLRKLKRHPSVWQLVDPVRLAILGHRRSRSRLRADVPT